LTSYTDLGQTCAINSNTYASDAGGGAISLAGSQADSFTAASLDGSKWSSGNWGGGAYSPTLSGSMLSIMTSTGGWVRSIPTYTHGVIEAVATFGNAAYQHIGFGSDGFNGNRYFLFSTYSGNGHLYARVNNNIAEQSVDLGLLPTGMHHYRIEWSAFDASNDQVVFLLDGAPVAAMTVTNSDAANFYAYLSNTSSTVPLQVDAMTVTPPYLTSGSYTSCSYNTGAGNLWKNIAWDPSLPAGTSLTMQVRTSADGLTWSGWSTATTSAGSSLPVQAQFIQFLLSLNSSSPTFSPLVNSVTFK